MDQIESIWKALESSTSHHFFLSWPWISNWIISLAEKKIWVELIAFYDEKDDLAAGLFIHKFHFNRNYFFPVNQYTINATGINYFDDIVIEHNTFLLKEGHSKEQLLGIFNHDIQDWDVLSFPGFVDMIQLPFSINNNEVKISALKKPSYFVKLDLFSEAQEYLNELSSNTRYQIKRSIREYEKKDEIKLIRADCLESALEYYQLLKDLHQKEWRNRGKEGAFSNQYLDIFHYRLISDFFNSGFIQLYKIISGNSIIGIIYNFEYKGKVYYYQSGFNYDHSNNKLKPGLVSHYFVIQDNLKRGMITYDFLAGNSRYKKSLSTDSNFLYWITIHKNTTKFKLETIITSIVKKFLK